MGTSDDSLWVQGARGGGPDSDMDVLIEVETDRVSFADKGRLRRVVGDVSGEFGIVISALVSDGHLREERGDFSIFQAIREEGIPV